MEISINIPVYNTSAEEINNCIQSCLDLTFDKDYEILIYNDGSTREETIDCLNKLNNPKIRIITGKENKGISVGRNTLLRNSKGKYIVNIDADDTMESNRLERQYLIMEESQATLLASNTINEVPWYNGNISINIKYRHDYVIKETKDFVPNPICFPLTCFNREWLLEHNIWYDETLTVCLDYKIYVDIFKAGGKILLHHEKLGTYNYGHGITQAVGDKLYKEYDYVKSLCH